MRYEEGKFGPGKGREVDSGVCEGLNMVSWYPEVFRSSKLVSRRSKKGKGQ